MHLMQSNMKAIKYMMMLAAGVVASAGCTDIEDYPDGRMEFEDIFQNPKMVGAYMNECYVDAVNSYSDFYGDKTYLASACDEAHDTDDATGGTMYKWNNGFTTPFVTPWEHKYSKPSEMRLQEWSFYGAIRRCNIMIERVETAAIRLDSDRESYRGEARGLRSYYYLSLIRNYGAVPLVLDNTSEAVDDWSNARKATYGQVVRQILKDCAEVVGYDPDNLQGSYKWGGDKKIEGNRSLGWTSGSTDAAMNRWNKAMSAGVMSEAALYAASPLNNDGTLGWEEAAQICKEALDGCLNNGYKLVDRAPVGDFAKTSYNAYDYFFISSIDTKGANDTESIIYSRNRHDAWQFCGLPTTDGQSRAGACPTQELVDCYETLQGNIPVLGYSDADHLNPIVNPAMAAGEYDPQNPYANRDPRLQASIYFHGAPLIHSDPAKGTVDISEGGNCMVSPTSVRYTRTGYYIRKHSSPSSSRNGNDDGWVRRMRLAELYLNFAEAANEANGPDFKYGDMSARDAVNAVRARVGMPQLPAGLSADEFRVRVRNERRVELAYEGHRFYDVRRWKILDKTDRVVTGMKVVKNADDTESYHRFVVSRRNAWDDKHLRLPIPGEEVARLLKQTGVNFQNSGWQ